MYQIKYHKHFHPSIENIDKKYILSHGKGIPCVCTIKKNNFSFIWYENIEHLHINKYLLYTNINKIDPNLIFSATSAYFGALADDKIRDFFQTKISFAFKIFKLIWTHLKPDYLDFSISIPIHELSLQFADGCLWDSYGLHSSLLGLKQERLLHNSLVIVFTNEVFPNNEWWEKGKKRHKYYPNSSIFKNDILDNIESSFSWDDIAYANVYHNCEIHPRNPFETWYNDGVVDLIVIGIKHPNNIASIPVSSTDQSGYLYYEKRIIHYLPLILDKLKIKQRITKNNALSICISGGACKTALLGMYALYYTSKITSPNVIAATSGGAWGVIMYYKYKNYKESFATILLENCKKLNQIADLLTIQAIRNIENAGEFSVLINIIPLLAKIDITWETVVKIIIDGNTHHDSNRKIFPSNLRVMIPISLLCNSRFGKKSHPLQNKMQVNRSQMDAS